jgi:hypothetical protein
MEFDVSSKRFAVQLAMMIDTHLLWYKHYYGWADELIAKLPEPPIWIIEIATIKYPPKALEAINRFVDSEPFEALDYKELGEEYIACLYLRYRIGATSWATFLADAGSYADSSGGRNCCEYFYGFLNELEDHEYSRQIACRQQAEIESEYNAVISVIQLLHEKFMPYFRDFVAKEE